MIRLAFIASNKEVIIFEISGAIIKYYDKMWPNGLKIAPLDRTLVTALMNSRSVNMNQYAVLITEANSGQNLEEYNKAKSEEDLAEIIKRDCKLKGLLEVQK